MARRRATSKKPVRPKARRPKPRQTGTRQTIGRSDAPPAPTAAQKISGYAGGAAATFVTLLGHRLGIFADLAKHPKGLGAADLAANVGLAARYVEAWGKAAYACELVDYDPRGRRFVLSPEMASVLIDPVAPAYFPGIAEAIAMGASMVDRLEEVMRSGGGIPFAEYRGFAEQSMMLSEFAYQVFLPKRWLPGVPGLAEKMAAPGALAVELGCGAGRGLVVLSKSFPEARIFGFDPDPRSVELARVAAIGAGADGAITVSVGRGEDFEIPAPATLVYTQISLHEMDRPDEVVRRIAQKLAPGGIFLVTEIKGAEKVEQATGPLNQLLAFLDLAYEIPQAIAKGGPGVGFFSSSDIARLVRAAGLPAPRAVPFDHPLYAVFWTEKLA